MQEGRSALQPPEEVQVSASSTSVPFGMKLSTHLKTTVWLNMLPSLKTNSVFGSGVSGGHVITVEREEQKLVNDLLWGIIIAKSRAGSQSMTCSRVQKSRAEVSQ